MSGSATWERVGQNSGLLLHWVPDNSGQAPLMISHWLGPADFTIVEHFGQRVCILRLCADGGHDQATSNPCHLSAFRIRFADLASLQSKDAPAGFLSHGERAGAVLTRPFAADGHTLPKGAECRLARLTFPPLIFGESLGERLNGCCRQLDAREVPTIPFEMKTDSSRAVVIAKAN